MFNVFLGMVAKVPPSLRVHYLPFPAFSRLTKLVAKYIEPWSEPVQKQQYRAYTGTTSSDH